MRKLSILIILVLSSVLLFISCSKSKSPIDVNTASGSSGVTRTPFLISTIRVGDTLETVEIEKTARITASSNLTLTSQ